MKLLFRPILFLLILLLVGTACRTFVVKDVDYAQQIESVLHPDENGEVYDARHALSFNILPFQYEEFQDSSSVKVKEVRLIRNTAGFYFITADGFSNVYVMEPIKSGMKLKNKIRVSESGLVAPAFNLRAPYVMLIDRETTKTVTMNQKGIQNREKQS